MLYLVGLVLLDVLAIALRPSRLTQSGGRRRRRVEEARSGGMRRVEVAGSGGRRGRWRMEDNE